MMLSTSAPLPEPTTLGFEIEEPPIQSAPEMYEGDRGFPESRPPLVYKNKPGDGVRSLMAIARRRKRTVFLVFMAAIVCAAAYTFSRPTVFRSEATLQVRVQKPDTRNDQEQSGTRARTAAENRTIATYAGLLESRTVASALVDRMKPAISREFRHDQHGILGSMGSSVYDFVADLLGIDSQKVDTPTGKALIVKNVLRRVSVSREPDSRLLHVSFDGPNAGFAQKTLKTYLDIFMDEQRRKSLEESRTAQAYLTEELGKAKEKLAKSRSALAEFPAEPSTALADDQSVQLIAALNKALKDLLRTVEERARLEAAKTRSAQSVGDSRTLGNRESSQSLRDQLGLLESDYVKMSGIYSQNYPPVVSLKKRIKHLKDRLAEDDPLAVTPAPPPPSTLPSLQLLPLEPTGSQPAGDGSRKAQLALLKKEVDTDEAIYRRLQEKSQEIALDARLRGHDITVVDGPTLPVSPMGSTHLLYLMAGGLLGLLGGLGAALFQERLDNSIHSLEDIEKLLNLTPLGTVPDVRKLEKLHKVVGKTVDREFLVFEAPTSPVAESIKILKTSLHMSSPVMPLGSLVVCSVGLREGASFIALSLASAISVKERRILLVDADLREPRLGRVFVHEDDAPGLTTLLTQDDVQLQDVLHRSKIPGLYYITAGPLPSDPVALLESQRMVDALTRFKRMFDLVIVDAPALIGFSDACILATHTDGIVLVVKEGNLPAQVIRQGMGMVTSSGARILGAVLNMTDAVVTYYGNTYLGYEALYPSHLKKRSDKKRRGLTNRARPEEQA